MVFAAPGSKEMLGFKTCIQLHWVDAEQVSVKSTVLFPVFRTFNSCTNE